MCRRTFCMSNGSNPEPRHPPKILECIKVALHAFDKCCEPFGFVDSRDLGL